MSRVSVIQPGARLHYAVPEILAGAGLLKMLYTDLHGEHDWLRLIERALPDRATPATIKRLLARRLPCALPPHLVEETAFAALGGPLVARLGAGRRRAATPARRLLARVEAAALGPGDVVYTVLVNEDIDVLRRLKARGVKIVHECMLSPDAGLWLGDERRRFPGIEPEEPPAAIAAGRARDREKYALADLVLVPSVFARDAVAALGCPADKIAIVPYGLATEAFAAAADPEPGRVLFVGSVGLRKGAHILAATARTLASRHPEVSVRVVGSLPQRLAAHPLLAGPCYLGQVPRSRIAAEFARADVFALPTLAEGMALAHLEAMAAGVPVVTTPNCGSVVREGVDGFIVPVRDADALTDRIVRIVTDRALRRRMSQSARARAAEFALPRYRDRLLAALQPLLAA